MEGEVISVYTKEQAIEDGVLFQAGELGGQGIILTTHLVAELPKEALLQAVCAGLAKARTFQGPDLAEFPIGAYRVWVDWNGQDLTFMFPEDY